MSKITFEAVKTAVEANLSITDRGDLVRKVAETLETTYGKVYLKVVKAEKELNLTLTSRKGRRPGSKSTTKALVNVRKVKTGEVVAEGVSAKAAAEMIAKAKTNKKAALFAESVAVAAARLEANKMSASAAGY